MIDYDNPWVFQGIEFTSEMTQDYQGFVYLIENTTNGKKYIGKKFFVKPKVLPKTKTRKRRVRTKVESDWKTYYGSSDELKADIEAGHSVVRSILKLCATKGECSYYEAKLQFQYDVLLSDEYYNEFIGVKVHSKHIRTNDDSD